jgi:hypothetical protein
MHEAVTYTPAVLVGLPDELLRVESAEALAHPIRNGVELLADVIEKRVTSERVRQHDPSVQRNRQLTP